MHRGTSTLVMGPPGAGKSIVTTTYALSACERGERVAMFLFDETIDTMLQRSLSLDLDLKKHLDAGTLSVRQVDPAEMSPGEFAARVRSQVEEHDAKVVIIDSINGFLASMPEEQFLTVQMHELLTYLGHRGVVTFMVVAQQGFLGQMTNPVDVSYLADTVLLLRFFESNGEVHKAISVVKKRSGLHEATIRRLSLKKGGISLGPPLREFHGVLTGVPQYLGEEGGLAQLSGEDDAPAR
jgi:circadian clock protein KaiC